MKPSGNLTLLLAVFVYPKPTLGASRCSIMKDKNGHDFVIGTLSPRDGVSPLQTPFGDEGITSHSVEVKNCFPVHNDVNLNVEKFLKMPTEGWNHIRDGIDDAISEQANAKRNVGLTVVIGPFYQNLAMILENMTIPYIVTDHMGFDWSDISRVDDNVQWKNMIEVRPPMQEFNSAIVDFITIREWESAVMIMPDDPKDNQECHNLARQMVENNISPIAYSLKYGNFTEMAVSTAEVLKNVQMLEQKKIIICSPRDEKYHLIKLVLEEARLFNMLADESYSFFILDPTIFLDPFLEINMYRMGLFAAQCDLFAYIYKDIQSGTKPGPIWTTFLEPFLEINMYRMGLFAAQCDLFAYRYKDIQNGTKPVTSGYDYGATDAAKIIKRANTLYVHEYDVAPSDKFDKERFLKSLKKVRIPDGATGNIKFNESGSRVDYTLSLYNHGGIGLYKKVGTWSSIGGYPEERIEILDYNETDDKQARGIFNEVETVVVVKEEPFIMLKNAKAPDGTIRQGNERYEGFTIDLINKISEDLNFKYEIMLSPDGTYGAPKNDRPGIDIRTVEWGGMVGQILAKNATLGMGAISITSKRQNVIDFSLGVLSTGVDILIPKPREELSMFQFLTPFSLELWMAILGASFGVSVIYFILDCRSKERQFTIRSTVWFSVGTLLMKGSDFSPRRTSQRILTTGFLFFVLITLSTYTANMAAFLTKKNLEKPIDSFEELANAEDLNVATVKNSATMNFLKTSMEQSPYHKLWNRVDRWSQGKQVSAAEGRELVVRGEGVFIFDSLINSYSEKTNCDTQAASAPILPQEHGIAMAHGAPFKSKLNIELLRLKESGFIQELKKRWWDNKRECDLNFASKSSTQVSFGLKHTAGVFIVGSFGLGAAIALFIFKKMYVLATPCSRSRKEENVGCVSGTMVEEKSRDPLIYGMKEGKQSTV